MKTDIETKYEYIKQYEQGKLSKKELSEALKLSRQQMFVITGCCLFAKFITFFFAYSSSSHRMQTSTKDEKGVFVFSELFYFDIWIFRHFLFLPFRN